MSRYKIVIQPTEEQMREKTRKEKLSSLAEKKSKGKLTLDDIYEQNQIIIEMLQKLIQ